MPGSPPGGGQRHSRLGSCVTARAAFLCAEHGTDCSVGPPETQSSIGGAAGAAIRAWWYTDEWQQEAFHHATSQLPEMR